MFEWYWALPVALVIILIHNIIASVYIHRSISHRELTITSPALIHFFRFWVWLFAFINSYAIKHWSAMHRIHHQKSDTKEDPHSPKFFSLFDLMVKIGLKPGDAYYVSPDQVEKHSKDILLVNDWAERHIYKRGIAYPIVILLSLFFLLFGPLGMFVVPLMIGTTSRGIFFVGYLTHAKGYRNRPAVGDDRSKNSYPIAIIFGGEELGANHHDDTRRPKFSEKWWEFDIGWGAISILRFFGLVKLHSDK